MAVILVLSGIQMMFLGGIIKDGNGDPIPDSPRGIPLLGDGDGVKYAPTGI